VTNVLAATRCPQCAALVRPGQPWCTLCHADLRPEPAGGRAPSVVDEPADAINAQAGPVEPAPTGAVDPLYAPLEMLSAAAAEAAEVAEAAQAPDRANDDSSTSGASSPEGTPAISDRDIEAMLAQLAAQTTDPLGGVGGRFSSRSAKVMLAVGVALGATAFLLVGAVVVTAIFG
jgi:hypothetical protein